MLAKISALIGVVSTPLMWVMIVLHVGLGLLGIAAPEKLRGIFRIVLPRWRIRLVGAALMIIGTDVFVIAGLTEWPVIVKALAIMLFIDGGVRLIIPVVHVVLTEWALDRRDLWLRALGLISFGFAYLYFLATQVVPVTEEIVETVVSRL